MVRNKSQDLPTYKERGLYKSVNPKSEETFKSVITNVSCYAIDIHFEDESLESTSFVTPRKLFNLPGIHLPLMKIIDNNTKLISI